MLDGLVLLHIWTVITDSELRLKLLLQESITGDAGDDTKLPDTL